MLHGTAPSTMTPLKHEASHFLIMGLRRPWLYFPALSLRFKSEASDKFHDTEAFVNPVVGALF